MKRNPQMPLVLAGLLAVVFAMSVRGADKPVKAFILAGQSNMVGWGDSTKLPDDLRNGNDRVLMFERGKWQPLRPHQPANKGQKHVGLTEFSFGPEIAFGHEMAKAWPDETIDRHHQVLDWWYERAGVEARLQQEKRRPCWSRAASLALQEADGESRTGQGEP